MITKICERCLEEYEECETGKIIHFRCDMVFCIPCIYQFKNMYEDFLLKFINDNKYVKDQKCLFCIDSNNIISKETCCTGCSSLK